jgi:hypothetical protein
MIAMKNGALASSLCAEYCVFYRPEKDEELACKGYLVVRRLVEQERDLFSERGHGSLSIEAEDALFHAMCRECAFFGGDCDFASWKRGESPRTSREAVKPCGGFLLLG